MSDNSIDRKPSETALFAALHRAVAHKEPGSEKFGPDDMAEYFLPPHFKFFLKFKWIRANVKNKLQTAFPGLHAYMIARTRYFDGLFTTALKDEVPQVVLLGAGYDSRPYRFAGVNRCTTIFELDSALTQARKIACLRKGHIPIPQPVRLLSIDFNHDSLAAVLADAGWQPAEKTLFIWEGVSYYLDLDSVNSTLEFVSRTAHPESLLAFDYTVTVTDENLALFGVREFYQSMQEHHAGEGLRFSIASGQVGTFLAQAGLSVVEHLDSAEIERRFLLAEAGALLSRIPAHFRFVTCTPDSNQLG